jgi:peptidoglycan/LPS O-acetylase OafA/YrhL
VLQVTWDGFAAVSLFFVLSGFVLSWKHSMDRGLQGCEPFSLASFWILRAARIWPPFLAALVFSAICQRWLFSQVDTLPGQTDWIRAHFHGDYGWVGLLKQAFFVVADPRLNLVPQDWTLRVELKFSFLMPFLILLATRSSIWLVLFSALCVDAFHVSFFLFHFTVGILMAKHQAQIAAFCRRCPPMVRALGLAAGIILYGSHKYIAPFLPEFGRASTAWCLSGVGSALIMISVLNSKLLQRVLNLPILHFLGRISYSVYLLHFAVLMTVAPWTIHSLNTLGIVGDSVTRGTGLAVTLALTVLASAVSYQFVERPSIRLGRAVHARFNHWRGTRRLEGLL